MQEFNATRDHQHLERRLQPCTDPAAALSMQFHPLLPFLYPICSGLKLSLGSHFVIYWLSFQKLQETKVKLTILY